jgi:hypothetical protein
MVSSQKSRMLTEEILRNSYSVPSIPVAIPTLSRSQSPTQNSTSKLPTTIETTKLAVVLQNPMTMEFLQFMPQTQLITTPTTSDVDGNVFKNAWSWPRHPQAPQLPHEVQDVPRHPQVPQLPHDVPHDVQITETAPAVSHASHAPKALPEKVREELMAQHHVPRHPQVPQLQQPDVQIPEPAAAVSHASHAPRRSLLNPRMRSLQSPRIHLLNNNVKNNHIWTYLKCSLKILMHEETFKKGSYD